MLTALNKSGVTTNILYDRTAGKAWLDYFGQGYANPDTSSVTHWLQAYYELRAATYNEPGTLPCRRLLRAPARPHAGPPLLQLRQPAQPGLSQEESRRSQDDLIRRAVLPGVS